MGVYPRTLNFPEIIIPLPDSNILTIFYTFYSSVTYLFVTNESAFEQF